MRGPIENLARNLEEFCSLRKRFSQDLGQFFPTALTKTWFGNADHIPGPISGPQYVNIVERSRKADRQAVRKSGPFFKHFLIFSAWRPRPMGGKMRRQARGSK